MCSARGQHLPQGVAAHARQEAEPGRATVTLDEQPNHRAAVLLTPETIRAEAAGLGGALVLLADRIFADADHPDQAARQVAGLLRLGRLHGTGGLHAPATAALGANVRSYRFVQHLLAKGRIEALEDPAGGPMPTCAAQPTTTDSPERNHASRQSGKAEASVRHGCRSWLGWTTSSTSMISSPC